MKTDFPKKENHEAQYYLIDAEDQTLGRLASKISLLLRGKETSFYTPGINQGNYVVVLNVNKIKVSGKKEEQKIYYRNNQRPGSLKEETLKSLRKRIPSRILEKAVWGMLPKGVLGREYYRKLYLYSASAVSEIENIPFKKIEF
jgi:large subunit ribosomal protein L13